MISLLHTKSGQKGNWFCAPITFKNLLSFIRKTQIVKVYFLFEKQSFNELLKVIGMQLKLMTYPHYSICVMKYGIILLF